MVDFALVRREHVLRSLEEYDDEGAETFLDTYGLSPDAQHPLRHGGHTYDTRAVMAVAYGYATGTALADSELTPSDAAQLARGLAFDVEDSGLPPLRFTRAATVGREHAHETWALAARERLVEVAGDYHAVVTRAELADYVQRRSLIRTEQQPQSWLGDVLRRVATQCAAAREPLLTSLVVDGQGRVGAAYAQALRDLRGEEPEDADEQASRERLECYRRFGALLPEDGGTPRVTVSVTPRRTSGAGPREPRAARQPRTSTRATAPVAEARPQRQAAICPVHFIELPPSGVCDLCD